MKRLTVTAFLLLAGLGARVEAGPLPKPMSAIARHRSASVTHYVRGAGQRLPAAIGLESRDRHRDLRPTHAVRGH
jgi:hypothetical protein